MAEVFIHLLQHVGGAALVLILGFTADYVASPFLKETMAAWIRRRSFDLSAIHLGRLLRYFLNGFIHRIFGRRIFSLNFLARSSIVSISLLLIVLILQWIFQSDPLEQFDNLADGVLASLVLLCIFLIVNLLIDYASNIQTISLLRMAARSGRLLDIAIVVWADILLTIALFTFLFPAAVVGGILVSEAVRPPVVINVTATPEALREMFRSMYQPIFDPVFKSSAEDSRTLRSIELAKLNDEGERIGLAETVLVFAPADVSHLEVARQYVKSISQFIPQVRVIKEEEADVRFEFRSNPLPLTTLFIRYLYTSVYRRANITREGFVDLLYLEPTNLDVRFIYDRIDDFSSRTTPHWVYGKCSSGRIEKVENEDYRKLTQPCDAQILFLSFSNVEPFWYLRKIAASGDQFPMTPFFVASFGSSILYYSLIALAAIGVVIARCIRFVFASPYFETTTKPFTLMAILVYPVLILGTVMFRWIF